jgi:hypothetical protein
MTAVNLVNWPENIASEKNPLPSKYSKDYTSQENLTFFFFGTRGKISVPNRTFNAEFKYVSSFSPSPTFVW